MNYKLEKNNKNKKTILILSIIICLIVLLGGGTYAFFGSSSSNKIDDIATGNATLKYTDNTTYMKNNLIPVVEEDVEKFASKNLVNSTTERKYTDEDICHYQNDMYACSLYEFTIENIANVSQSIYIDMIPTLNEYNNLYFILYESEANKITPELNPIENKVKIEQETINFDNLALLLKAGQSKTYTIVFYIKSLDIAQDDANKRFAASISVNSLTTGYNEVIQVGTGCYDFVNLRDGTLKLSKFNGIDHTTGDVIEACGVTKDDAGYYTVTVPSTYSDRSVSTLGNSLFYPIDMDDFDSNDLTPLMISKHYFIKELTIEEGITIIEDGVYFEDVPQFGDLPTGMFSYGGINITTQQPLNSEGVKLNFPNSLEYLGNYSFSGTLLKEIKIPSNLEYIGDSGFDYNLYLISLTFNEESKLKTIGDSAFRNSKISTLIIPSSVETIEKDAFGYNENLTTLEFAGAKDGTSKLKTIGEIAFRNSKISTLIIPSSVETIEKDAFGYNENLTTLEFAGAKDGTSKLKTIGEIAFRNSKISTLIIPSSVETIGERAFYDNENLTTLEFAGANDGTSKLKSIVEYAFCNLKISTIIIPSSVETIGERAFYDNENLTTLEFAGAKDGTSKLKTIGENAFYYSKISTLIIPSSVETIGKDAFGYNENLTTLEFAGAKDGTSKLKTIGEIAFRNSKISTIIIPASVENIEKNAFGYNENLTTLEFVGANDGTSKLKSIVEDAFCNSKISSIIIPASVETIGERAFYSNNSNLTTLTFMGAEDGTSKLKSIGEYAFYNSKISTLIIPASVETIGECAFDRNINLTTLEFVGANDGSSKLKTIGNSAFYKNNISTLIIPASVETIGDDAFNWNKNLTTLEFVGANDGSSKLKTIGNSAFGWCNLTYLDPLKPLVIPVNVTFIGEDAFVSELDYDYVFFQPYNYNLHYIKFNGTLLEGNTDWYNSENTTLVS